MSRFHRGRKVRDEASPMIPPPNITTFAIPKDIILECFMLVDKEVRLKFVRRSHIVIDANELEMPELGKNKCQYQISLRWMYDIPIQVSYEMSEAVRRKLLRKLNNQFEHNIAHPIRTRLREEIKNELDQDIR